MNTTEIYLRAPEPEDLDFLLQLENESEAMEAGTPATGPYSRFQLKRYIAQNTNDLYTDRELRLMIGLSATAQPVGIIDVFSFDPRHQRAEVGIVVQKGFRGRGIAAAALTLLERHCFGLPGVHQLYAFIRKDNKASLALFLHRGYEVAGEIKDWTATPTGFQPVLLVQKINPAHST